MAMCFLEEDERRPLRTFELVLAQESSGSCSEPASGMEQLSSWIRTPRNSKIQSYMIHPSFLLQLFVATGIAVCRPGLLLRSIPRTFLCSLLQPLHLFSAGSCRRLRGMCPRVVVFVACSLWYVFSCRVSSTLAFITVCFLTLCIQVPSS